MVIYYWLVAESPSIPDSAILIRKKPPQTRELAGLSFGRTMVMPSTLFAGLSWIRNTRIPESGFLGMERNKKIVLFGYVSQLYSLMIVRCTISNRESGLF